jgi:predicted dehydrogenase/threonine dehydrogenase-like Zn-dependent dehydrogenase
MKQIILPFNTGQPELIDVPAPMVKPGEVLIKTQVSVISSGTERMLLEFGKAGYLGKLRQQPEKVKQVLTKLKNDGLAPTIKAVRSKLDTPIPMGYSSTGIVIGVGAGVTGLTVGDRVACNGPHAEIVCVPKNLVAKVPNGVSEESAAFTVLGAIALQSVRLVQPTFGETVVVIGLGLIGQLTAQLLRANGCRVIGSDLNKDRLDIAVSKGVEVVEDLSGETVRAMTKGHGADAVIITASSNNIGIVETAADICRKRGRIVLTGVVPMQLSRDYFFKKELTFQVSASYGPGRYERRYEQQGLDYPIGYVRWTEGRNFEAVLDAMARGQIDVQCLISSRVPFDASVGQYDKLDTPDHIAGLFIYPESGNVGTRITIQDIIPAVGTSYGIGVIGAGNFSSSILLPALKHAGATLHAIVSKNGLSGTTLAQKYKIPHVGTDVNELFGDTQIGAVVIATPHNTHAELVIAALESGKHVFVEKPLAFSRDEVAQIYKAAVQSNGKTITVGFNRRYASLAANAKDMIASLGGPCNVNITINAGALPAGNWLNDKTVGGGRLLGEGCHFIDLCRFFVSSPIVGVCANVMQSGNEDASENASVLLRFADGSNAVVNYFCNGSRAYDKERVELYKAGRTIIIANWRSIRSFGFRRDIQKRLPQDKGHATLMKKWVASLNGKADSPIAFEEIMNSSLATIAMEESLATNHWVVV